MRYEHTQHAPLYLLLVGAGAAMLVGVWFEPPRPAQLTLFGAAILVLALSAAFGNLTVRDAGDHLLIQFGPLPLFRRRVAYEDIERVNRTRLTFLDGWGIHLSPSGGWTWNIWGFDCVDLFLRGGRKLRLGTDDPEGLGAFLQARLDLRSPAASASLQPRER